MRVNQEMKNAMCLQPRLLQTIEKTMFLQPRLLQKPWENCVFSMMFATKAFANNWKNNVFANQGFCKTLKTHVFQWAYTTPTQLLHNSKTEKHNSYTTPRPKNKLKNTTPTTTQLCAYTTPTQLKAYTIFCVWKMLRANWDLGLPTRRTGTWDSPHVELWPGAPHT